MSTLGYCADCGEVAKFYCEKCRHFKHAPECCACGNNDHSREVPTQELVDLIERTRFAFEKNGMYTLVPSVERFRQDRQAEALRDRIGLTERCYICGKKYRKSTIERHTKACEAEMDRACSEPNEASDYEGEEWDYEGEE